MNDKTFGVAQRAEVSNMARFTSSDATLSIYILLLVSSLPGSLAFNKPLNANLTLLGPPLGDIPSTCEGLNISTDKTYLWNSSYDLTRRDYNFKPDSGGPPPPLIFGLGFFPPVFSTVAVSFLCSFGL